MKFRGHNRNLNNTSQSRPCKKILKILTQFQGRSRIPEGTSQRLGGCGGLAKHKSKLQSGTNNDETYLYKKICVKRIAGRTQASIHSAVEVLQNCQIQVIERRECAWMKQYTIVYPTQFR